MVLMDVSFSRIHGTRLRHGGFQNMKITQSSSLYLTDTTVSTAGGHGFTITDSSDLTFVRAGAFNHSNYGIQLLGSSAHNTFNQLMVSNNGYGVKISQNASNTTLTQVVVSNQGGSIDVFGNATGPVWNEGFDLNGYIATGNAEAVHMYYAENLTIGNVAFFNLTTGVSLWEQMAQNTQYYSKSNGTLDYSSTFYGKVTADDAQNTQDTDGQADWSVLTDDWDQFDDFFRSWGRGSSLAFPDSTQAGRCTTSNPTCQIYDFRLRAGDSVLRAVHGEFEAGKPCPASVDASASANVVTDFRSTPQTYLQNAIELIGYSAQGDQDGLCESGETCLFMPNIGAYQGEGELSSQSCEFTGGNGITNVTILGYSENGVSL
jgi:hypothetical protein